MVQFRVKYIFIRKLFKLRSFRKKYFFQDHWSLLNFHSCLHIGQSWWTCWELSHFMMQWMWKKCEHWPQTVFWNKSMISCHKMYMVIIYPTDNHHQVTCNRYNNHLKHFYRYHSCHHWLSISMLQLLSSLIRVLYISWPQHLIIAQLLTFDNDFHDQMIEWGQENWSNSPWMSFDRKSTDKHFHKIFT